MPLYLDGVPKTREELAARIDHTVLKPTKTLNDVLNAINDTIIYGFRSLVIPPWVLDYLDEETKKKVRLATVVGFPLGHDPLPVKKKLSEHAIKMGARELDVVINISAALSGRWDIIEEEVTTLTREAHEFGCKIKFIVETGLLDTQRFVKAAKIIKKAGADYVKTNTGFGPRGVTIDDVVTLRRELGPSIGIKASGGIRTAVQALLLIAAGADIIGTSSGVEIIRGFDDAIRLLMDITTR